MACIVRLALTHHSMPTRVGNTCTVPLTALLAIQCRAVISRIPRGALAHTTAIPSIQSHPVAIALPVPVAGTTPVLARFSPKTRLADAATILAVAATKTRRVALPMLAQVSFIARSAGAHPVLA